MRGFPGSREEFHHTLTGGVLLQLPELPLVEQFDCRLDRTDGVEQISVEGSAVFAPHHRRLGADETFLLQAAHILAHGVLTHTQRLADGLVAGVALVGFSVLDAQQIAVDGDLWVTETDVKYFVGNLEIVFVGISFGPLLELHIAPPVCSSTH